MGIKILSIIALSVGMVACVNDNAKIESKTENQIQAEAVEVIYFHTDQRCPTCRAIEKHTVEVINTEFVNQLSQGDLVFSSVNISDDEELADRYEVSWSSLILVDRDGSTEEVDNLTTFAFANARNNPEEFKRQLTDKIQAMLND